MSKEKKLETLYKEKITHSQIVRYAGASGDFHPVHTVTDFAKKAGHEDVIVHGMLVMGFIGQAIITWFPVNKLIRFKNRFESIIKPGESIKIQGEIINNNSDKWVCKAIALNELNELKATAEFEIQK